MDESSMDKFGASAMFHQSTSLQSNTIEKTDYLCYGENSPTGQKTMTIVDGRFFKMIPEKCVMNTTVATCVKCEPRYIEIKGNVNSSSNFLCHLKRKHGAESVQEYTEYLRSKKRFKRPAQLFFEPARQVKAKATQAHEQLERNILKFIIHSMLPIETVSSSYFLEIFRNFNIAEHDLEIFNQEHLKARFELLYQNTLERLKNNLEDTVAVCSMVNIWQGKNGYCFVITVHWIDKEFKRQSAVLKIQKLSPKKFQLEVIDSILKETISWFNIKNVQIYTFTGKMCNFSSSFSAFGFDKNSINFPHELENTFNDYDELTIQNDILSPLEPHQTSCYVQILSHFASIDVARVIANSKQLSSLHRRVMNKCNVLWSHPDSGDILEEITGIRLIKPSFNNWTSVYTALREILTIKDRSMEIFQAFELKDYLDAADFLYIEEHLACTKPLADALAIFEGTEHSLFGSVLPTLLALRRQLNKLCQKEWTYCGPIALANATIVYEKFKTFYGPHISHQAMNAAVAAFSHPEFKNRWLSCLDNNVQSSMLQTFKSTVEAELPKTRSSCDEVSNEQSLSDFFDFGSENDVDEAMPSTALADMQVLNYFNYNSRSFESLTNFPEVYKVFMKYNSPLSSFSIVERMISQNVLNDVLLSDEQTDPGFDMKIVLKANMNLL